MVVDEAWAILGNLGVARWLQTSWKLSRALGVANMAVLHRLSDLRSVGREGSEQVSLAEGLLADSETRVVYAQSPGEVARTGELLGLTDTEAELVTQLRRGMALWKVGRRSFLVEHRLASGEQWLTDTDQAMAEYETADLARTADPSPPTDETAVDDPRPTVRHRPDDGIGTHRASTSRPEPGGGCRRCRRRRDRSDCAHRRGPARPPSDSSAEVAGSVRRSPLVGPPGGRLRGAALCSFGTRRPHLPPPGRRVPPPGLGRPVDARLAGAGRHPRQDERFQPRPRGREPPRPSTPAGAVGPKGRRPATGAAWCSVGWGGGYGCVQRRAQSLIVFGPTQSYKTSGLAVPAILGWEGPVIAASVKTDLIEHTIDHRRQCGSVRCFDPVGINRSGLDPVVSAAGVRGPGPGPAGPLPG